MKTLINLYFERELFTKRIYRIFNKTLQTKGQTLCIFNNMPHKTILVQLAKQDRQRNIQ